MKTEILTRGWLFDVDSNVAPIQPSIACEEDMLFASCRGTILEMYSGQDLVEWWGSIQRTLKIKMDDYAKKAGKERERDQLEAFLHIWNSNQITGSVSRGTVNALSAAATQASARSDLETQNFFSHLRDKLNRILASVEELPTVPSSAGKPMHAPKKPMTPSGNFAAQQTKPGDGAPSPDAEANVAKAAAAQ